MFTLLEEEAHHLDFQLEYTSSVVREHSLTLEKYALDLEKLASLKEERANLQQRADIVEQVLTLSAVNNSTNFTTTPQLVTAMMSEAGKLRHELETLVALYM